MKNFYLIVGLMGSGKDTIVSEITTHIPMKILKSYSTRPKRFDSENTHTFISKYKFGKLKNKIAVSIINKEWYGTTEDQIEECDIGVYDNNGAKEIIKNYRGNKKIKIIYVDASENIRLQRMLNRGDGIITSLNRIKHDADVKEEVKNYADIIINNNNCDLQQTVQAVVSFIKEKENESA